MSDGVNADERHYDNGEITVDWKKGICQHSGLCWKGLNEVFNPRKKPWIELAGSTTEKIIEQIKKCPSGALGYRYNLRNQDPSN